MGSLSHCLCHPSQSHWAGNFTLVRSNQISKNIRISFVYVLHLALLAKGAFLELIVTAGSLVTFNDYWKSRLPKNEPLNMVILNQWHIQGSLRWCACRCYLYMHYNSCCTCSYKQHPASQQSLICCTDRKNKLMIMLVIRENDSVSQGHFLLSSWAISWQYMLIARPTM